MVFMVVSGFLVVLAVATTAVLLFWSWSGKPKPFLDEGGHPLPDSIAEKVRVDINGFEQGMFLRAKDKTRPVTSYWSSTNWPSVRATGALLARGHFKNEKGRQAHPDGSSWAAARAVAAFDGRTTQQ